MIYYEEQKEVSIMNLKEFLVLAKENGYASGRMTDKINNGARELIFEKLNYKYIDKCVGHNPFIGEEIVFEDEKLIWGMNYYGFVESLEVSPKEVYTFLKEVLLLVKEDEPFRGPRYFKRNDFEYFCEPKGTLERFVGFERIDYKEKTIYRGEFHGGIIKEKIPEMILKDR